ncbi:MAG TPA: hypothetical protein VMQ86_01715, partial [Bryobacteraceae bacterium]|nr:hypothetical protein [Bryobacteraceae bacterium]
LGRPRTTMACPTARKRLATNNDGLPHGYRVSQNTATAFVGRAILPNAGFQPAAAMIGRPPMYRRSVQAM